MRIWHTIFAVFLVALLMTIGRDPAGRVAIVVFASGLIELVVGLSAVMMLFQTVGAIGEARGTFEHVQGFVATGVVLVVATTLMVGLLSICVSTIQRVV